MTSARRKGAEMKAVMSSVPPEILEWRRQTGADRFDEMWDGVLHIGPSPNRDHQDLEWALETYLRSHWAPPSSGRVYHQINVARPGRWPKDYRIPDLVLLTPDRAQIDRNEYFEGAPDVVVEICSPDDETFEKLPFYAQLGVPEVWVIYRDSKVPEILSLEGNTYRRLDPDADGWIKSDATSVRMRGTDDQKLLIEVVPDPTTRRQIP
jgi:Uma2 family endonuclease